ncbi:MAG: hypothetical protein CMK33_04095 [Porticoccaceae bacterium]|nr:hypothetical protein [Porticoccaceae bacterium]
MFANLSLRWKTLGPVLAMGLTTLLLAGYSVNNARQSQVITQELGGVYLPALSLLLEADRDLYQVVEAERSWLSDPMADSSAWRKQIDENREQSKGRVEKVSALFAQLPTISAPAASLIETYRGARTEWEADNDRVIAMLERADMEGARRFSLGDAAAHFDTMREQINQLTELLNGGIRAAEASAESKTNQAYTGSVILGAIALVILCIALVWIPRFVLSPIRALNGRLKEVSAGGGDLTVRLPVRSHDETGQMSASFNQLLDNLGSMFRQLHGDADKLATGVQQLETVLTDIGRRSESLSDISQSNAASIEEITVSVSHIADHSDEADSLARETGELTGNAAREVATIASEAAGSADRVRKLSEVLRGLDERSQSILGIVGAIREIADQTNLLALNAAIEAARAGEQGRGFAVVADEVRKLAERTGSATVEINGMLDGMRGETQQAVSFMDQAVGSVDRSAELTSDARTKIEAIGTKISAVAERMSEVALSINEQRGATSAIAQSTEDITVRVQETDSILRQARQTVDELASVARSTQTQFSRFKL